MGIPGRSMPAFVFCNIAGVADIDESITGAWYDESPPARHPNAPHIVAESIRTAINVLLSDKPCSSMRKITKNA
jgi:hypothetical protein